MSWCSVVDWEAARAGLVVRAWQVGIGLARWVPEPGADLLCRVAGALVYLSAARVRARVLANLSHVRPLAGEPELRRLARRVFYHAARNYYDLMRLPWLDDAAVRQGTQVEGQARLDAALAHGRGVIAVAPHLGSFSTVPQYAALAGYQVTVVMERLEPPALYELVAELRARRGVRIIEASASGTRQVLAALRRGELIVLVGDRDITGTGVSVPFFGWPARLPIGPAVLALRTGAVLLPMFTKRIRRDCSMIVVQEPVTPAQTGMVEADVEATTAHLALALETAISEAPDQWVVLQPVWRDAETSRLL